MKRSVRLRLHDVLKNIDGIEYAVSGKTFEDFRSDWLLRHGIERGMEIISEASKHIPENLRQTQPELSWRGIIGIGNILRHDYENVSEKIIWNAIGSDLPPLRKAIVAMLATLKEDD